MTLIVLQMDDKNGAAVSDLVLSSKTKRVGFKNDVKSPLLGQNFSYDSSVAELSQKCVIIDKKCLIMWAGDFDLCAYYISEIYKSYKRDPQICIFDMACEGINKYHRGDEISIIAFSTEFNGDSKLLYHNAIALKGENSTTIAAGSGAVHYLEDLNTAGFSGLSEAPLSWGEMAIRLLKASMEEIINQRTIENLYGGWMEFILLDGPDIVKVPYSIKIWTYEDGALGASQPLMWSEYFGDHLIINRIDSDKNDGFVRSAHAIIDPLLRTELDRDSILEDTRPIRGPEHQFHAVIYGGEKIGLFYDYQKDSSNSFMMTDGALAFPESILRKVLRAAGEMAKVTP